MTTQRPYYPTLEAKIAEKIADALGMTLMYSNGVYRISEDAVK